MRLGTDKLVLRNYKKLALVLELGINEDENWKKGVLKIAFQVLNSDFKKIKVNLIIELMEKLFMKTTKLEYQYRIER